MSHMQPQITEKQRGWKVETREGTSYVPSEVVSIPWLFASGRPLHEEDNLRLFEMVRGWIADYVGGDEITEIEVVGPCYFCRLYASGYTDCTDWTFANTLKEAREYLRDL